MKIVQTHEDDRLLLKLSGRLDSKSAPELEALLKKKMSGLSELIIDVADVGYISSAGLRLLLIAQDQMMQQGEMRVIHPNRDLMDIFDVTGFTDILTLE